MASSRDTVTRALRLLNAHADSVVRRRFAVTLALTLLASILGALAPLIFKTAIDSLAQSRPSTATIALWLIVGFLLSHALMRVSTEIRTFVHGVAEQHLQKIVSVRLFSHLLDLPLAFHIDRKTGAIGETLNNGMMGYQLLIRHSLFTLLPAAIELATVAVVLIELQHPIYLFILGAAAAGYVIIHANSALAVSEPARRASAASIEAYATLTDSLLNTETIKCLTAESRVAARYEEAVGTVERNWRAFFLVRTRYALLAALVFVLSLSASLLQATREVLAGSMTLGGLVLVHTYLFRLTQPLELVGQAVRDLAQGVAFLERLLALFQEPRERQPDEVTLAPHAQPIRGEIEFRNVSFAYLPDRQVLHDVSFTARAGTMTAIVGSSGSGKSTLVRLLMRFYSANSGRIFLDGVPIDTRSIAEVRGSIAVVAQDTVLFNDTIAYNLELGRPGSTDEQIYEVACLAGLQDLLARLPAGMQTRVGERGLKLSGGEKQRVAIARAALRRPQIFILDEATSSLDSATERFVQRNLHSIASHCTTLVIAHRLSTIVHADQILVLNEGRIVERGTHAQLLAANGAYARLWRAQLQDQQDGGAQVARTKGT